MALAVSASVMSSRPHDALFKWAFETPAEAGALLRELLPPALRDAVAWDTLDHEPGSFVDVVLADRHNDLLFSAHLRAGQPDLVFLLLEHQSTESPVMPLKTLSYQLGVWNRFRKEHTDHRTRLPPVIGVLVSHVPGGWTAARSFEELLDSQVMAIPGLAALVPRFSMVVEDLAWRSNSDLKARSLAPFQKLALWLLRDARDPVRLLDNFGSWRSVMIEAGRTRSGLDSFRVLIHYMLQVIDPSYAEDLRARLRELGTHFEESIMSIADCLREEGRQEGRQAGRQAGVLASLRKLLLFKFQHLGAEDEARLQSATTEALERYFQRALDVDSLAAVFED